MSWTGGQGQKTLKKLPGDRQTFGPTDRQTVGPTEKEYQRIVFTEIKFNLPRMNKMVVVSLQIEENELLKSIFNWSQRLNCCEVSCFKGLRSLFFSQLLSR